MTGEPEIKIPYQDLTKVTVVCKVCGGEMAADLTNPKQNRIHPLPDKPNDRVPPLTCGLCNAPLDSGVGTALAALCTWYRMMSASQHQAFFRIAEPT